MNIFGDWRFWLFTVSIVKDFVLVLGIILVKFNDLRHLDKDVSEIKESLDKIDNRLGNMEKQQSAQQAVCNERHNK